MVSCARVSASSLSRFGDKPPTRHVFVTGGTGFMGRRLIEALLRRGHSVRAMVRVGLEKQSAGGVRGESR